MNFTRRPLLANETDSGDSNGWNSTTETVAGISSGHGWTYTLNADWTTYTRVTATWIFFVVGTVGNIIVLVVLLWRRSRSQVGTQLFVGSLAVSDLGYMLGTAWVKAYDELQEAWPFGVIPCKLQFMWQWLTLNSSIWTLAAISIDRYVRLYVYLYVNVHAYLTDIFFYKSV